MFPEDLQPEDFVRVDGDVGHFRMPSGERVSVDLRSSPYARQVAARALVERSAAGRPLFDPGSSPQPAAPPPAPPPGPMSAPMVDGPMSQAAAPVAPAAAPPMPAPMSGPAAPAQPVPPAAGPRVPTTDAERAAVRQQYAFAQMMPAFQPQAPAEAPTLPVAPVPGAAPMQPSAQPAAPAMAAPIRIRREEAPPTLDQLMVPGGALPEERYQGMLAQLSGGTPAEREDAARRGLIDRAADLEARRADAAAEAARQQAEAIDASEMRRQQIERDRRVAMGDAQRSYVAAVERLGAMREDPARVLRSAGGAVSAAIAIGLGAAGAALAGGGENSALAIIQRNIDRDIAAQRTDLATAGNVADARRGILGIVSQEFSSRDAAESAARAAMLQAAQAQAARVTAGLDNEAARLRGEELQQQLSDQAAAAAAEAQRQEAEWRMNMALSTARLERIQLRNATEARALAARAAGAGAGRAPTAAQMRQFNTYVDSGADPREAARIMRIAPELVPASGRFALGVPAEEQRPATSAMMGAYNQMRESGMGHEAALSASGMPTLAEPPGGRFAVEPLSAEVSGRIAAAESALATLEDLLPESGDIPGIGAIQGRLSQSDLQRLGNDTGAAIRQAARTAAVTTTYVMSGANAGDREIGNTEETYGLSPTATPEEVRRGVRALREMLRGHRRSSEGQSTEATSQALQGAPGLVRRRSE